MRLAGVGLAVGLVLALPLAELLRDRLYGLSPFDPLTYLGVMLLFGMVALAACWLPARRAAGVDPMIALRTD
jgi:ABC-type antimicrobial peptide transport system permease subunit